MVPLCSPFLLLANVFFPGTWTSTLPNKARYLLWRFFVLEEACRPLFLVVVVTMENFLSEKVAYRITVVGTS